MFTIQDNVRFLPNAPIYSRMALRDDLRVAYTEALRVAQPSVPYKKLWAVKQSVKGTAVGGEPSVGCQILLLPKTPNSASLGSSFAVLPTTSINHKTHFTWLSTFLEYSGRFF
ncbi:unnamed protein product [Haemonchus placei]|uniref:Uncharacterized protein n=1 Tax=Haemonchus placei TaxID=6290 RepID=A0A3P7YEI5_HAEPC|nr:unnamed protein product [Haemonchus placei]